MQVTVIILCTFVILSEKEKTQISQLLQEMSDQVHAMSTGRAIDDVIRLRLLELVHSTSLADGLVLAGTVVEGGAVFNRQRRILGGKRVRTGRDYFRSIDLDTLQKCPPLTLWYRCENWVPTECEVIRYLLFRSSICTCKVNVC